MNPTVIAGLLCVALAAGCYGLYQRGEVLAGTVEIVEGQRNAAIRQRVKLTAQNAAKDRALAQRDRVNRKTQNELKQAQEMINAQKDACLDMQLPEPIAARLRSYCVLDSAD